MRLLCQAAVLLSLLSVPGWSDQILYSNGEILGGATGTSYSIASPQPQSGVFDTFFISSDSTVTGISNIGLWVASENTPLSLSWAICLSICADSSGDPLGVLASGSNVTLSSSIFQTGVPAAGGPFDIFSASFSVNNLDLSAAVGTYTLELYNAVAAPCPLGCNVGWDVNGGPSAAYVIVTGSGSPLRSNSFEVDGNVGGNAPEPGTFPVLSTGLFAIFLIKTQSYRLWNQLRRERDES
jgi:hypothetical protein